MMNDGECSTEPIAEDTTFTWLEGSSWDVAYGPDIAPNMLGAECANYGEVILVQRLDRGSRF